MIRVKPLLFARIAALAAVALVAPFASPALSADPVQVNVILTLTGSGTLLGTSEAAALQIVEKQVNASGGIRGRPVQFVVHDDQSNPQLSLQLADQIIAQKAQIILGSSLVGDCSSIVPVVAHGPVLYCFSPGIHPPAGSYAFTAGIASGDLQLSQIHYLHLRHLDKLAWLGTTDASGQDGEAGLNEAVANPENAGMTVIDREHFNVSDLSVDAQLARIKAANPDALVTWASGTPMGTVMHGINDVGLTNLPTLISAADLGYTNLSQFAPMLGSQDYTGANAMFSSSLITDRPVKQAIEQMIAAAQASGRRADFLLSTAFDPAMIVVSALRRLGPDATAEQIRSYIAGLKGWAGVNGVYDYAKFPQRGIGADWVVIIRWHPETRSFTAASKPGGRPV